MIISNFKTAFNSLLGKFYLTQRKDLLLLKWLAAIGSLWRENGSFLSDGFSRQIEEIMP